MCGIVGIWRHGADRQAVAVAIERMSRSVRHRGPDGVGEFTDSRHPLALGHRRLAVIDTSPTGHQPMTSRSGRWTIVFNGELYNFKELRRRLESRSRPLRGTSDTEVLLELIDLLGLQQALELSNAMFALAVWDSHREELHLARDRVGEKPLYFVADPHSVVFGSELRSIRAGLDASPTIDDRAVAAYLRWSFVPHPYSVYTNVQQVQPGELITVSQADGVMNVRCQRWWDPQVEYTSAVARRSAPGPHVVDEFLELLAASVSRRMHSDVPLGAFLSGGIDSSLVAAAAQAQMGSTALNTFTLSMPELGLDEADHAREIASFLGTSHTEIVLGAGDAIDEIRRRDCPEFG